MDVVVNARTYSVVKCGKLLRKGFKFSPLTNLGDFHSDVSHKPVDNLIQTLFRRLSPFQASHQTSYGPGSREWVSLTSHITVYAVFVGLQKFWFRAAALPKETKGAAM
jgi:hypothetical protein